MDALAYWNLIKSKKMRQHVDIGRFIYNFPNKVSGAQITGGINWSSDSGGVVEDFSVDVGSIPSLQRVSFAPQSIPYEYPDEDKFAIFHYPDSPWRVVFDLLNTSPHPVGTGTLKFYTTDPEDPEGPLVLDDTRNLNFYGQLTLVFGGGGHPISGGRGVDSDEKRMGIFVSVNIVGVDADIPGFVWYSFNLGGAIPIADCPFPWDATWPGYSDIFSDSFDLYTSEGVTASCNIAFNWTY
jgi:hypothetical protein